MVSRFYIEKEETEYDHLGMKRQHIDDKDKADYTFATFPNSHDDMATVYDSAATLTDNNDVTADLYSKATAPTETNDCMYDKANHL